MTGIVVAGAVLDGIVAHARAEAPNECCGLLVGTATRIEERVPTRNVLASPNRYRIDPAEHFTLIRRVRGSGAEIVGAYHSHVRTAAEPSPRDIDEAHDPGLLYVIVSLQHPDRPDVRGYRIRDGQVERVALRSSA